MSALISVDDLSISTPDSRLLFSGLSLSVGAERLGLVGRNGCGKSTLLSVLTGAREPSGGTVRRFAACALMDQSPPVAGRTWADGLGVAADWARLSRIEAGTPKEDDLDQVDWTLESRIAQALDQAGLPARDPDSPLEATSGGQRTRIAIARLFLQKPDLLLLDEPTNNLDAEGRALILDLVREWPGGVILASHDRELLEEMDRIVELTPAGCHLVTGGWSAFEAERAARRERVAREIETAGASLDQMRKAAQQRVERKARSDKQGRAVRREGSEDKLVLNARRQRAEGTEGRLKAVSDRQMEAAQTSLAEARAKQAAITPLSIDLPASGLAAGQKVLALEAVSCARGGRPVLQDVSLEIRGPERIHLTGPNGGGKSTLLALAAGRLAPDRGAVFRREGEIVMLDQHAELLDREESVLENCRRANPEISAHEARALLARFAFRNEAALKKAGQLSGGERLRAGLACALGAARPPKLLILDEPSNHLDLEAIEVLEAALAGYDGALLIASHDPAFCERVGFDRAIEIGGAKAPG
jgi:ATPase subunit of ABC transporter with duplicated ATPase domains